MGSSKNCFLNWRVLLPGSRKYFLEYLRENENIFENILVNYSKAYEQSIHEKTRHKKSHACVPLRGGDPAHFCLNLTRRRKRV